MKIAAISDDGISISQHFGRAPIYVVMTVEESKITAKETRPKAGHHTFAATEHQPTPGEPHGYDAGSQAKHRTMADTISDCEVLIAGGMGWGAYESMMDYGIKPIVTNVQSIDEAAQRYISGSLENRMDQLH